MSDMVTWLKDQITERRQVAIDTGSVLPWKPVGTEGVPRGAVWSAADAAHILLNDPRDVIARCDAELAILELHKTTVEVIAPGYQAEHNRGFGCPVCHDWDGATEGRGDCETVGLLAEGYQHRPGFKEDWRG